MPLVVVAVLVATTVMAALLKWHAGRGTLEHAGAAAANLGRPEAAATPRSGLGAGTPPPSDDED